MTGRLALLALCATVALAAPAGAQGPLPVPLPGLGTQPPSEQPPPSDQPQRPPDQQPAPGGPSAGAGEVGDYFGAGGAKSMPDDAVFGPLTQLWTRRYEQHLSRPLLVRGKLIINVAADASGASGPPVESRAVAYDVATGRELWSRPTPGIYFTAHLASDGERVVSLNGDGVVRAFAVADGRPLWESAVPDDSGETAFTHVGVPAIGDGVVVVGVEGRLVALRAGDGSVAWERSEDRRTDGLSDLPIVAGGRVFSVRSCGRAVAFEAATGRELWRSGGEACEGRGISAVVGDRVYSPPFVLDAATGARVATLPRADVSAIAGGLAIGSEPYGAFELATGRSLWRADAPFNGGSLPLGPVVVGPTVYSASSTTLVGRLLSDGRRRSQTPIPENTLSAIGGPLPGITAGQGVIAVADEGALTVLTGVLRPRPDGTDAAAARYQLITGQRTVLAGGVGTAVARRRVTLQADRFPYGRWRRAGGGRVADDRTLYLRRRVTRNTRFRFAVRGARGRRGRITVYARPKLRTSIVAPSPRRVVVRAAVLGPRDMPAAGRRLVVYLGDTRRDRVRRLGFGVLRRTGRGRFSTTVGFRAPANVGSDDVFVFCVRGLARRGFGVADRFERHCGARRQRVRLVPPS